jgi:hypothetical protein
MPAMTFPVRLMFPALLAVQTALAAAQQVPGERSALHQTAKVLGSGAMAEAMQAQAGEWTMVTITARGRSRTDVTAGTQPGWEAGQYMLFDAAEMLLVRPASKTFERFRMDAPQSDRLADSLGIRRVTDSVRATLDSGAVRDTVDGVPADRYTMRMSFRSTTKFDSLPPGLTMPDMSVSTSMVLEHWHALTGAVASGTPPGWLTGNSMIGELASKLGEVSAGLPKRPLLRTRSIITIASSIGSGGMERTTRMGAKDSVSVDLDRLMLPAHYTQSVTNGAAGDTLWIAKWRRKP